MKQAEVAEEEVVGGRWIYGEWMDGWTSSCRSQATANDVEKKEGRVREVDELHVQKRAFSAIQQTPGGFARLRPSCSAWPATLSRREVQSSDSWSSTMSSFRVKLTAGAKPQSRVRRDGLGLGKLGLVSPEQVS